MPAISSAANPLLKDVRRAIARGGLTESGCCIAEGFHLLDEALRSRCDIAAVLASEAVMDAVERRGVRARAIDPAVFAKLAGTETSQGVIALVRPPAWSIDDVFRGRALVLVLDGVQDPGNAGTIARTAEAFGASGLLFLKGSVNPWNPKALRASAGSLFRIPVVTGAEDIPHNLRIYAAMPSGPSVAGVDLTIPCALVIGSEGRGVSERIRAAATEISIPTAGVESLNAAIASAILLYEARRQRS